MLTHLCVDNVALIDHIELELSPGLTVLSGETGAGKSILVEALLLLLGGRASVEVIRSGAAEASVQAQFVLHGDTAATVSSLLERFGLPAMESSGDGGTLLLRRVVSREGRHKQLINGTMTTVAQLRELTEPLIDFTGQHAHQQLLRAGAAQSLVDGFGSLHEPARQLRDSCAQLRALADERDALRHADADKARRLDLIAFELAEIDRASPKPGEDEALASEERRLKNAGRLQAAVGEALDAVADGESPALVRVQHALTSLRRVQNDDPELAALVPSLEDAVAIIDDVCRALRRHRVEDDEQRLQDVADRLDALRRLMRKHGGSLALVMAAHQQLQQERNRIEHSTDRIEQLQVAIDRLTTTAAGQAAQLRQGRQHHAPVLARAIAAELPALGMASARVEIDVMPMTTGAFRSGDMVFGANGADTLEMKFSANAGEPLAGMAKVASGGELSRVLLGLKRALLAKDPVPVSVFDEVDAGVGGAVGEAIGEKLQAIAMGAAGEGGSHRQVLCITHLGPIAARADAHVLIEKVVEGGRTLSRVRTLTGGERVTEVARMIGGRELTDATLRLAEDLLSRSSRTMPSADGPAVKKKRKA